MIYTYPVLSFRGSGFLLKYPAPVIESFFHGAIRRLGCPSLANFTHYLLSMGERLSRLRLEKIHNRNSVRPSHHQGMVV